MRYQFRKVWERLQNNLIPTHRNCKKGIDLDFIKSNIEITAEFASFVANQPYISLYQTLRQYCLLTATFPHCPLKWPVPHLTGTILGVKPLPQFTEMTAFASICFLVYVFKDVCVLWLLEGYQDQLSKILLNILKDLKVVKKKKKTRMWGHLGGSVR